MPISAKARSILPLTFSIAATRQAFCICALLALLAAAHAQSTQSVPPQGNPESNGQQSAQQLPDAPGVSDRNETGPVQQLEDKTREAAAETEEVTREELLKARDWEATWISGEYIPARMRLVTPTKKQRKEIYLRQTLTTPQAYMKRMFEALFDQARGVPSQWDDGWAGYAERFASREGQFLTANTLAALGNAKLGYEVRYDQCRCSGAWPRARHAILRNFLTYNRTERELRPQWALYGGAFAGGLVASSWKPAPKNPLEHGGLAVLGQAGYGTLLNLVIEFSREINAKQGVK